MLGGHKELFERRQRSHAWPVSTPILLERTRAFLVVVVLTEQIVSVVDGAIVDFMRWTILVDLQAGARVDKVLRC